MIALIVLTRIEDDEKIIVNLAHVVSIDSWKLFETKIRKESIGSLLQYANGSQQLVLETQEEIWNRQFQPLDKWKEYL